MFLSITDHPIYITCSIKRGISLVAQTVRNPPAIRETRRRSGFDPLVGKIPWRRERLPTPVFWPREFHGLYSPWGHKESDMTEWLKRKKSPKLLDSQAMLNLLHINSVLIFQTRYYYYLQIIQIQKIKLSIYLLVIWQKLGLEVHSSLFLHIVLLRYTLILSYARKISSKNKNLK